MDFLLGLVENENNEVQQQLTTTKVDTNFSYTHEQIREFAHDNNARFIADLEFITLLTNADYLRYLATSPDCYFEKPEFIEYLHYLSYMFKITSDFAFPDPTALYYLRLLQSNNFRKALQHDSTINELRELQQSHWAQFRENQSRTTIINKTMLSQRENGNKFAQELFPLDHLIKKYDDMDEVDNMNNLTSSMKKKQENDNSFLNQQPNKKPKIDH